MLIFMSTKEYIFKGPPLLNCGFALYNADFMPRYLCLCLLIEFLRESEKSRVGSASALSSWIENSDQQEFSMIHCLDADSTVKQITLSKECLKPSKHCLVVCTLILQL
jgi:hypothetical protein